ncbi:conserved protein of unknown function [Xenorhabdus poinarii G6]|uniref:Uncharacterized protein n=1 Tax=Xenorhabdus poinarii G6 TaxID=1354304 RepID=A0A068R8E4_9GAMM|nr:hypothetical protein [Xenorhabdus poinarii]CDG22405.1 conserved protein of unknown function [Xenorhabdus poinarii G6]
MEYKYLLSMNTHRSVCVVRLNEMMALENVDSRSGTESSGFNVTAFLENGNNTLSVSMGKKAIDRDFKKFNPDSWCEAIIRKASSHDQGQIISYIKLSVDKNGDVVTHTSPNHITDNSSDLDFSGMSKTRGEKGLYQAKKTYSINELPDWMWTKASPVSEKNLPSIKAFYQEVIDTFSQKDLDKLWKMSKSAWEEWAIADNSNPKIFFNSMDFEEMLNSDNYSVRVKPEWEKFRLVSYKNGRLFRLEKGAFGRSPILLDNKYTGDTATYSPYLSIINGKVVIAR